MSAGIDGSHNRAPKGILDARRLQHHPHSATCSRCEDLSLESCMQALGFMADVCRRSQCQALTGNDTSSLSSWPQHDLGGAKDAVKLVREG